MKLKLEHCEGLGWMIVCDGMEYKLTDSLEEACIELQKLAESLDL